MPSRPPKRRELIIIMCFCLLASEIPSPIIHRLEWPKSDATSPSARINALQTAYPSSPKFRCVGQAIKYAAHPSSLQFIEYCFAFQRICGPLFNFNRMFNSQISHFPRNHGFPDACRANLPLSFVPFPFSNGENPTALVLSLKGRTSTHTSDQRALAHPDDVRPNQTKKIAGRSIPRTAIPPQFHTPEHVLNAPGRRIYLSGDREYTARNFYSEITGSEKAFVPSLSPGAPIDRAQRDAIRVNPAIFRDARVFSQEASTHRTRPSRRNIDGSVDDFIACGVPVGRRRGWRKQQP